MASSFAPVAPGRHPGDTRQNDRHHGYLTGCLGYSPQDLSTIPTWCLDRFRAVGNPLRIVDTDPRLAAPALGETVLDHACLFGVDLILAARRVGPFGRAIGVAPPETVDVVRRAARASGTRLQMRIGDPERLPVESGSVDVVISHGATVRCRDRAQALREIRRVLKPGGRLLLADVVQQRPFSLVRSPSDGWQLGGCLVDGDLPRLAGAAGLVQARITERFDCFAGTPIAPSLSSDPLFYGANLYASKEE